MFFIDNLEREGDNYPMPAIKLSPLAKELSRRMFVMDLTVFQVVKRPGCSLSDKQLLDVIEGQVSVDRYIDSQLCLKFGGERGYWLRKYGPKEPPKDLLL
jgi:hypothetical protein